MLRSRRKSRKALRLGRKKHGLLRRLIGWIVTRALRLAFWVLLLFFGLVLLYRFVPVLYTPYMLAEARQQGAIEREWVGINDLNPALLRALIAAEDADFCQHYGLDFDALTEAWAGGARRGGSTISQQTAKNVFLWHGRSWLRKGLEAGVTFTIETAWPKWRILEIYANVAEFDTGVFGVEAAAQQYYGIGQAELSLKRAAMLATLLPAPKLRDPHRPSREMTRRAALIADGAQLIEKDGRAACITP